MKTPEQILGDIRRRLARTWHIDIAHEIDSKQSAWPHSFPIGMPSKTELETGFDRFHLNILGWRDWAAANRLTLTDTRRIVHGTSQPIPTHLVIGDTDTAASLCGPEWTQRLDRARQRARVLTRQFPALEDLAGMLNTVDGYTAIDFELLCAAAEWFSHNSAAGLTPRQVPIPGLHAKWLNTRHRTVAHLAGIPGLELLPAHPARLHFTYLDPDYRRTGKRLHDSTTVGDAMTPAYRPSAILVSENKDTALHFPELSGVISVEGAGFGASSIAAIEWIHNCPTLIYWGDMDAAGLEILNGFRKDGLSVTSLLMDIPAYEIYERYGTNLDVRGNPITARQQRLLPFLTEAEAALYARLTNPAWERNRRIEQERIPLAHALRALTFLVTRGTIPA